MTAHGSYGTQGAGGPGDAADLVRSYALSAARLWEEVLERLERVEQSQNELREAMVRLRSALPPGAADGEPALGSSGVSALDAGAGQEPVRDDEAPNAAHAARGLTAKDAVDLLFGDDASFADEQTEDGLVSMAGAVPPQPWESANASANGTADEAPSVHHAVDAFGETSWSLQEVGDTPEATPAVEWGEAAEGGSSWVLGSDEEQFGVAPPPPPEGFTGYHDVAVAVPPPPPGFESFGEPAPPRPPEGFTVFDDIAVAIPPPPAPPAGFTGFEDLVPSPPPPVPPPPPPPPGFHTPGEPGPATPPPPPPGFESFAEPTQAAPPPPPPGFTTGSATAQMGAAAPSQPVADAAGQETQEVPITPDFFARAGRRR